MNNKNLVLVLLIVAVILISAGCKRRSPEQQASNSTSGQNPTVVNPQSDNPNPGQGNTVSTSDPNNPGNGNPPVSDQPGKPGDPNQPGKPGEPGGPGQPGGQGGEGGPGGRRQPMKMPENAVKVNKGDVFNEWGISFAPPVGWSRIPENEVRMVAGSVRFTLSGMEIKPIASAGWLNDKLSSVFISYADAPEGLTLQGLLDKANEEFEKRKQNNNNGGGGRPMPDMKREIKTAYNRKWIVVEMSSDRFGAATYVCIQNNKIYSFSTGWMIKDEKANAMPALESMLKTLKFK